MERSACLYEHASDVIVSSELHGGDKARELRSNSLSSALDPDGAQEGTGT